MVKVPVSVPIGTELWHYTDERNIPSIKKFGLLPSRRSLDGVDYVESRIYFALPNEGDVCAYLKDRTIIAITYDGSFPLFRDTEYDWYYGEKYNPMMFTVTTEPIPPEKICF